MRKKPHYSKHFSDLEEDLEENKSLQMQIKQVEARNVSGPFQRINSEFNHSSRATVTCDMIESVPKLTTKDIKIFLTPQTDQQVLDSALMALEDANLLLLSPDQL